MCKKKKKKQENNEELRIFIIRHACSEQNAGIFDGTPDYLIPITSLGKEQAKKAGEFLAEFIKVNGISLKRARSWTSPYKRPKQTANIIQRHIGLKELREDILLIEKQFGQFQWSPYSEWQKINKEAFEHYQRCQKTQSKAFAQLPSGESPIDVAIRMRFFAGTLARDRVKRGIKTVFIYTHGVTLRALVYQLMHYDLEWYENEKNPNNCAIRYIERRKNGKYKDHGYIYEGAA